MPFDKDRNILLLTFDILFNLNHHLFTITMQELPRKKKEEKVNILWLDSWNFHCLRCPDLEMKNLNFHVKSDKHVDASNF